MPDMSAAQRYMMAVQHKLTQIMESQMDVIQQSARAIVTSIQNDGMVYLFGTGHSHMLAEEGHYRAGGLVPLCPILSSSLMLHEGAVASSAVERTRGVAGAILQRYALQPHDVMLVFSNSGVNAVPVEMAQAARAKGMTVIAVVALDYAATVPPIIDGQRLADIADIVIDNGGIPGDALVDIHHTGLKAGPLSTVAGAFILNAILVEASEQLGTDDAPPPVYISSNMPGAVEHNQALLERYQSRNPHL